MEKLKSAIPSNLNQLIADATTPNDLPLSSSSLLSFLLHFPPFHQMVEDLVAVSSEEGVCGKNKDKALRFKSIANKLFATGDYSNALSYYSQALRVAPIDADESGRNLVATLYLNRAFVFHKMSLLMECVRDCNRAIQISPSYAKAWYKRGMTNVSLGNHKEAINDLNVAEKVELSAGGKRHIENELKMVLDRASTMKIPPMDQVAERSNVLDEAPQMKIQSVTTPDKARGMASTNNIPSGSLVHMEEPFAAIILKSCRETHCHYCFNELPVDKVPCSSCSIQLYCSVNCQLRARGKYFNCPRNHAIQENLPENLKKYVSEIIVGADPETDTDHMPEQKHECQGGSWPLVLPSEIVLAGRIFVKSVMQRRGLPEIDDLVEILVQLQDLAHHYLQMAPERKLELHIYSIVLLCCLARSNELTIEINGLSVAQVVILISQIRVNAMSIVRLRSMDDGHVDEFENSSSSSTTGNVEQVKVGLAIYETGSLFNHSCQPSIHAYFLSRTLFMRTTEFVPAGSPLELSYGPQVGQWDCKDRVKILEDEYSFCCQCSCCSITNFSDLVLNAFRCIKLNCTGVVLDSSVLDCEKNKIKKTMSRASTSTSKTHFKIGNIDDYAVNKVAVNTLLHCNSLSNMNPGHCLRCGSYRELKRSLVLVNSAEESISRLEDAIMSKDITSPKLSEALRSLDLLRSNLHPYNRRIAEVEDIVAQAFCMVGDLQMAKDHCRASIKILKKLYNSNHIVIGHELVKLASIQLALADSDAIDTINRVYKIFSCYYGSDDDTVFPLLKSLRKEVEKQSC